MKKYYRYVTGSDNKNFLSVDVYPIDFNCAEVKFPIFSNCNEENESFLIQLKYMYETYLKFISDKINHGTIKFDELPYCVVKKLDSVSKIFYGYLKALKLMKFLPNGDYLFDMNFVLGSPYCEYFYYSVMKKDDELLDCLLKKHLVEDKNNSVQDTDFN